MASRRKVYALRALRVSSSPILRVTGASLVISAILVTAKTDYQFFCLQLIQNVTMTVGPIVQYHQNSKYYSACPPRPNKQVDNDLPHMTIQMPVYKEGLDAVLCALFVLNCSLLSSNYFAFLAFSAPSIASLKKAMQTYARQGGTSNIFINDDGLRVILLTPWTRHI
jgi:hypothetical protein